MFKALRIAVLLLVLFVVVANTWLTQSRSTDWDNSLWVKIYPVNADGEAATAAYIASLALGDFEDIEAFFAREARRYGQPIERPVRMELGELVAEQPPTLARDPGIFSIAMWSLKMRWWIGSVTNEQDTIEPDVSIFVRYHESGSAPVLEDSVGIQKGMFGIVNAYTGRRYRGANNMIIAHELLHTLGASDKYELATGQPTVPDGLADPGKKPLYPQSQAEIMGGRIALAADDAVIPQSLGFVVVGPATAAEVGLVEE
jgi:hypothetical protein